MGTVGLASYNPEGTARFEAHGRPGVEATLEKQRTVLMPASTAKGSRRFGLAANLAFCGVSPAMPKASEPHLGTLFLPAVITALIYK